MVTTIQEAINFDKSQIASKIPVGSSRFPELLEAIADTIPSLTPSTIYNNDAEVEPLAWNQEAS